MMEYGSVDAFYEHCSIAEAAPFRRLIGFLRSQPRVRFSYGAFGETTPAPTVAFVHATITPEAIAERCRSMDIAVRY